VATILVVDDETTITDLLQAILEEEGYWVLVAHNGRDALRIARAERPDLVLSDVMMPQMDGVQLAEALRTDPEMTATAVILMSAGRVPETATTRVAAFVGKPFAIEYVVALVARFVVASHAGGGASGRAVTGNQRRLPSRSPPV